MRISRRGRGEDEWEDPWTILAKLVDREQSGENWWNVEEISYASPLQKTYSQSHKFIRLKILFIRWKILFICLQKPSLMEEKWKNWRRRSECEMYVLTWDKDRKLVKILIIKILCMIEDEWVPIDDITRKIIVKFLFKMR